MIVAAITCPFGGRLEFREHSPKMYSMFHIFGEGPDDFETFIGYMTIEAAKMWWRSEKTRLVNVAKPVEK